MNWGKYPSSRIANANPRKSPVASGVLSVGNGAAAAAVQQDVFEIVGGGGPKFPALENSNTPQ
jgi:hypothetical protein